MQKHRYIDILRQQNSNVELVIDAILRIDSKFDLYEIHEYKLGNSIHDYINISGGYDLYFSNHTDRLKIQNIHHTIDIYNHRCGNTFLENTIYHINNRFLQIHNNYVFFDGNNVRYCDLDFRENDAIKYIRYNKKNLLINFKNSNKIYIKTLYNNGKDILHFVKYKSSFGSIYFRYFVYNGVKIKNDYDFSALSDKEFITYEILTENYKRYKI